ncbi:hypothetical protein Tco_0269664 [Tanacetum coccineum]
MRGKPTTSVAGTFHLNNHTKRISIDTGCEVQAMHCVPEKIVRIPWEMKPKSLQVMEETIGNFRELSMKYFPEYLPGLPPTTTIGDSNLIRYLVAAPVARHLSIDAFQNEKSYQSKLKKLSRQSF